MPDVLIDDDSPNDILFDPQFSRGAIPRDYSIQPAEFFAAPSEFPLIPRSEWDARIDEQERTQSSLEHVWRRSGNRPLDQNGQKYCWTYSTGNALMATRARMNQPAVRLSPHGVACKIKGFKDQGGWSGLSAQFAREKGYPSVEAWPEKSMSRAHDNPATWEDAKKYKDEFDVVDLTRPAWGQNLTVDQYATLLLMNYACPSDFNFWAHSVCALRWVRIERGSYGPRILNSWYVGAGVPWGDNGFATLRGSRAVPDGALAIIGTTAS